VECTLVEPFNGQTHSPRIDDDLIVERLGKDDAEPNWSRQSTEADDGEREMFCKLPDMNSTSLWNTDTPTPLNDEDCGDDESEDSGDDAAASPCAASTSKSHLDRWSDVSETLIFFDWDDTLCPTSHAERCPDWAKNGSPFGDAYFVAVTNALRTACSLGRVVIVTMASKGWVSMCIEKYMPSVKDILVEFDIQVVEARTIATKRSIREAFSGRHEACHFLKTKAMATVLRHFYGSDGQGDMRSWKHVLSVGDSEAERCAIQDLVFRHVQRDHHGGWKDCRCKTILLERNPDLEKVIAELVTINKWLPTIVYHDGDLDLDYNSGELVPSFEMESRSGMESPL